MPSRAAVSFLRTTSGNEKVVIVALAVLGLLGTVTPENGGQQPNLWPYRRLVLRSPTEKITAMDTAG
jgi:hypothetical protein